jgi:hypothetical protein
MHLNLDTALDFLEGRMVKDQGAFWSNHLETCKDCTQDVARLRQLGIDLKRSHLRSASDQDLRKAAKIFPPQRDSAGTRIRTVVAAIIYDSFVQPAMAGARGAAAAARQLVIRTVEFDIHVKIWDEKSHRQMLGQLLPRSGSDFVHSARFHLLRNGERVETTDTDDMGEFHFMDVPEGDLSLQVDLPNLTVIGALHTEEFL